MPNREQGQQGNECFSGCGQVVWVEAPDAGGYAYYFGSHRPWKNHPVAEAAEPLHSLFGPSVSVHQPSFSCRL